MAITVDFSKEFADLICTDIPKQQSQSEPCLLEIPDKYQKEFIHTEKGFAKLFCEEYD